MIVTKKAYAKLNLALSIVGSANGFHLLDSVVVTVNVFDTVRISPRKDKKINLSLKTAPLEYMAAHVPEKDNAYRAAKLFMEKTGCNGVDISISKNIPISSGMGGSSTDASAVLAAMSELYGFENCNGGLEQLANALGSDTAYLLHGGYARLNGRGDIVKKLNCNRKLNFVVVVADGGVPTKDCFDMFDKMGKSADNRAIDRFIDKLNNENTFDLPCVNALFGSAVALNEEVGRAYNAIKSLCPSAVCMTGSGSAVFGIFETQELCEWARLKLQPDFSTVFTTTTFLP